MSSNTTDNVARYIREKDIAVFKRVAKRFNLYIAVRRTNPASLEYIPKVGYEPKQLNCKFKTADRNAVVGGQMRILAGIVVNPTLDGMASAFEKAGKHQKSKEIWNRYARELVWQEGDSPYCGKPYLVDTDPESKHFGALMSGFYHSRLNAKYIHGDYDLYDIVDAANPRQHIVVREQMYGGQIDHVRVPQFKDVQNNLNIGFGAPMVRHGSQAGFSDFTEDDIDVFFPDGATIRTCLGEAAIRELYATEFQGRGHIHLGRVTQPHSGLWIKPA